MEHIREARCREHQAEMSTFVSSKRDKAGKRGGGWLQEKAEESVHRAGWVKGRRTGLAGESSCSLSVFTKDV